MMIYETGNGLKGQHNLAQGKRSVALGLKSGYEIRPRENVYQYEFLRSDEIYLPFFMGHIAVLFRPKKVICFAHRNFADGFSSTSFTQGGVSVRSSRNSALGYDILAFQAGRNAVYKE